MNDATLTELRTLVERVVRPLVTTVARKRQLREELLAHLTATFTEEHARLRDEAAALAQTKARFGDPAVLTGELRRQTGPWIRIRAMMENQRLLPGESIGHFAVKHALFCVAVSLGALTLGGLKLLAGGRFAELQQFSSHLAVVTPMSLVTSYLWLWLSFQLAGAIFGEPGKRSAARGLIFALVAALVFPLGLIGLCWAVGGSWAAASTQVVYVTWTAPIWPVLVALQGWQLRRQFRYDQDWANLVLDEQSSEHGRGEVA